MDKDKLMHLESMMEIAKKDVLHQITYLHSGEFDYDHFIERLLECKGLEEAISEVKNGN